MSEWTQQRETERGCEKKRTEGGLSFSIAVVPLPIAMFPTLKAKTVRMSAFRV